MILSFLAEQLIVMMSLQDRGLWRRRTLVEKMSLVLHIVSLMIDLMSTPLACHIGSLGQNSASITLVPPWHCVLDGKYVTR